MTTPQMRATDSRARGARLPRSARRVQLLGAAREVFVAQGYHAAAMDEIAERAGVSKPVLYQHFPGKRDLYIALIQQHTEELRAAVRRALASTTDNKLRVAATIQAFFEFVDADGEAFRLVFESDLTNDEEVRAIVDRSSAEVAQAIADVIQEDTGLPEQEAVLLGVALAGMANTTARYWVGTGKTMPRELADRLVAQLSWRGIRGFPKTDGVPGGNTRPGVG
ncbi:MAG TPA: TetR/AcrR family transcriptional regulator [Kineosporiaceae bacterium]|nr:TetR/AcrR family transcriptional regulator [Kineosporiaceae bacterium]